MLLDITKYPFLDLKIRELEDLMDGRGVTMNAEEFISVAEQDTFTLTNGSYVVGSKTLQIVVDGVPQSPSQIFELTAVTFKLNERLPAGIKVVARWLEGKVPVSYGHKQTHEKGGQDELDIAKLKGFDELVKTSNVQEFITTEGQDTFTLTNGSYVMGSKTLQITVDQIPQPPSQIMELTPTSFKVNELLPAGLTVVARWLEGKMPMHFGHNKTHEKGGQDELDITKLKGYDELAKTINRQEFISVADQDTFVLTNGSYTVGSKTLEIIVDSIPQPPSEIIELTSTSFKLSEKLPAGIPVMAKWLEGKVPAVFGHNRTHEKGGQDELDISKLKGYDELVKTPNQQEFISLADQDVFTITNGSYTMGSKTLQLVVDGVPQPPSAFTELSPTTFQLSEKLPAGIKVYARWLEGKLPVQFGHSRTHEVGGADELDVTKMKGYKENVGDKVNSLETNVNQHSSDIGVLSNRGSNTYRSDFIILPYRKSISDRNTYLAVSQNGVDFQTVSAVPMISDCADPSIRFISGEFWTLSSDYPVGGTGDFKISRSKDLKNQESFTVSVGFRASGKTTVWAPEWFEDINGRLYVLMSAGSAGTATDVLGNTINDLRTYISEVIDLENLVFSPAKLIGVEKVENTSKIDPFIYKTGSTYQLLLKDEYDKNMEIWQSTSTDLLNATWTKVSDSISQLKIFPGIVSASDNYAEGAHVIEFNNKTLMYVDYYVRQHMGVIETNSTLSTFTNGMPLRLSEFHRHGTPYVVKDAQAKDIVASYIAANISVKPQRYFKKYGIKGLTDTGDTITTFKPQDNVIYQLNGNESIVINSVSNDFGARKFAITLASTSDGSITIKNSGVLQLNADEIVLVSGGDANILYEFQWVDDSQAFQMITKLSHRTTVGTVDLSTLATNNAVSNFNPKESYVYRVTGTQQITINGIDANCKTSKFYLLVASTNIANIVIPNGASRISTPLSGLRFDGIYGDGNILFEFLYDRAAQIYRVTNIPTYNVMSSPKWFKEGTVDPTTNAEVKGQHYRNTTTGKVFLAVAVTGNASDWTLLN